MTTIVAVRKDQNLILLADTQYTRTGGTTGEVLKIGGGKDYLIGASGNMTLLAMLWGFVGEEPQLGNTYVSVYGKCVALRDKVKTVIWDDNERRCGNDSIIVMTKVGCFVITPFGITIEPTPTAIGSGSLTFNILNQPGVTCDPVSSCGSVDMLRPLADTFERAVEIDVYSSGFSGASLALDTEIITRLYQ